MPQLDLKTQMQERLLALRVASLLEVSAQRSNWLSDVCDAHGVQYQHCDPLSCAAVSQRFDLALVHNVESYPPKDVISAVGLVKNLLSERVCLVIERSYCPNAQWIALGFKGDSQETADSTMLASFSYNLQTYNHKRDWNNPRFWANPENWGKRF